MEERTMAIKQDKECYTKWTHVESGKVLVRRIHRIEVQARNGGLYTLRGKELPDFIQTSAGEGHRGAHLAQILLSPESIPRRAPFVAPVANPWPSLRDLMNVGIGFLAFVMLRFTFSVLASCL
jgi:hypothetical protein